MQIVAVGDVAPGGILNGLDTCGASKEIKKILTSADLVIATLETAVGNKPSFYKEKMDRLGDVIYIEDNDLKRLNELNINVVNIANNHFFDLGIEGARHTIELLDQAGIQHCGAGNNIEEAGKPVIFEGNGKKIAIIGFCDLREEFVGWCPYATSHSPGVNPMKEDYVLSEISKNAKLYDYVIVIPHWGKEYQLLPQPDIVNLSKKMLQAGASFILGGHTHCVQPVLKENNKIITYSMGNFLFPDRIITKPRSTFYPHPKIDVNSLPKTCEYPYVEKPTFKIWRPLARIGCIYSFNPCSPKKTFSKNFTYLSRDNEVQLLQKIPLRIKINHTIANAFLGTTFYSDIFKLIMLTKKIIRKLRAIIKHLFF